jgi:hypothetical protein
MSRWTAPCVAYRATVPRNPNPPMSSTRSIGGLWSPPGLGGKTVRAPRGAGRAAARALGLGLAASLAAGLSGCASQAKLLKSDPSFTASALDRGRLAVVSVVEKDEVEQVRPPLIEALVTALARARPDLRVVSARRVSDLMGPEPYRTLLRAYQSRGSLDSAQVGALEAAVAGDARYALLGRVTSDVLRTSEREIPTTDSTEYRYFNTLLVTGRDARVEILVYDLARRELVYRAQYLGSAETQRPARYVPQPDGRGGVTFGEDRGRLPPGTPDSLATASGRYPAPPELAQSLAEAFHTFASDLPR